MMHGTHTSLKCLRSNKKELKSMLTDQSSPSQKRIKRMTKLLNLKIRTNKELTNRYLHSKTITMMARSQKLKDHLPKTQSQNQGKRNRSKKRSLIVLITNSSSSLLAMAQCIEFQYSTSTQNLSTERSTTTKSYRGHQCGVAAPLPTTITAKASTMTETKLTRRMKQNQPISYPSLSLSTL